MKAWTEFLLEKEKSFGKATINKWLRTLKITHFDACNIYLEAQDNFQLAWFNEHIKPLLKYELLNNNGHPIKVHIKSPYDLLKKTKHKTTKTQEIPLEIFPSRLEKDCSFDSYLLTEENQMSFQFLSELIGYDLQNDQYEKANNNLAGFNPIYLYGESGSGKTHLLSALAARFINLGYKTFFVHAQNFTNHVVQAIRSSQMESFRKIYRNIDILLVDDIHILARKNATQEEFFHTFNTLHTQGSQIILSSNMQPSQLVDIEPRLISRFEWGITLPLFPAKDKKIMRLIVEKKIEKLQLSFDPKAVDYLMETFHYQIKSIHEALHALILRSHLESDKEMITIQTLQQHLSDLMAKAQKKTLLPQNIIEAIAKFYGIKTEDILGKAQTKDCVLPRKLAMYFCRHHLHLPFQKIGSIFSRDHSTVMTSIRTVQGKIDQKENKVFSDFLDLSKII